MSAFSEAAAAKIDALCERYPNKQAPLLMALHIAQAEFGCLDDEAINAVADHLGLPVAHVYGVVTFYVMFRRKPAGENILRVCTNVSCMLRGAYDVMAAFEKALGVKRGETAGEFTIVEEECIAACANAPAVVCGTRYLLDVTPDQVEGLLEELRERPHPESEVV